MGQKDALIYSPINIKIEYLGANKHCLQPVCATLSNQTVEVDTFIVFHASDLTREAGWQTRAKKLKATGRSSVGHASCIGIRPAKGYKGRYMVIAMLKDCLMKPTLDLKVGHQAIQHHNREWTVSGDYSSR